MWLPPPPLPHVLPPGAEHPAARVPAPSSVHTVGAQVCLLNTESVRHSSALPAPSPHDSSDFSSWFWHRNHVISNLKLYETTLLISMHAAQMVFGKLAPSLLPTPARGPAAGLAPEPPPVTRGHRASLWGAGCLAAPELGESWQVGRRARQPLRAGERGCWHRGGRRARACGRRTLGSWGQATATLMPGEVLTLIPSQLPLSSAY